MNCPHCKKYFAQNPGVCPQCGFQFEKGKAYNGEELLGFSPQRSKMLSGDAAKFVVGFAILGYMIAFAFVVITPVMYLTKMANITPGSVIVTVIVGVLIASLATKYMLTKRGTKTYEGEVIGKDSQICHDKHKEGRIDKLQIKKDDGSTLWLTLPESASAISYYHRGDRVRVHRCQPFPEKYDKRRDSKVICIHCGTLNDMSLKRCKTCDTELYKYGNGDE